jgi:natural product biosynthesis luciferase-like monooxygenase protein
MDISIMFFSCVEEKKGDQQYQLLLDATSYADKNNFSAVWLPEKHFNAFGGLYPNPAIISAALASITNQIQLRAGSVVSPIHDIIRIAEEWSVVDNLSKGRVGLSFASGTHPNDFVFYPDNYSNRFEIMYQQITQFQKLWCGQKISRISGAGDAVDIELWPKPYIKEVPIWISIVSNQDAFRKAGELGYNVLTNLVRQNLSDLEDNISVYKSARRSNNLDPESGSVTLMLHTHIDDNLDNLSKAVEIPFKNYLKKIIRLGGVKNQRKQESANINIELENKLVDIKYNHYINSSSLIGTSDKCLNFIRQLKHIGVTEIAALIDFGINPVDVMESLVLLNDIRNKLNASAIIITN